MSILSWIKTKKQKNWISSMSVGPTRFIDISSITYTSDRAIESSEIRRLVNPIDVVSEIFEEHLKVNCDNLTEKIKQIKIRMNKMIKIGIKEGDIDKTLNYLISRKYLVSHKESYKKEFYWPITTEEKIKGLLNKYTLSKDNVIHYQDYIPDEGIKEIEKYCKLCQKVNKKFTPLVEIIMPDRAIKENIKSRDPIIISESPFGKFYFVLGAWDKEVKIMHELWE